MSSKATTVTRYEQAGQTRVDIVVVHRDNDSFSRSVDRAAMSKARTLVKPGEHWSMVDGKYAHEEQFAARDPRPWWVSTLTFVVN